MSEQPSVKSRPNNEVVQFLPFVFRCLRSWYLFVLFLILAGAGAWIYLERAVPQYQAMSSILIQKDNNSDLVASSTFGLTEPYFADRVLLADEMEVLKSRKIAENVVRAKRLNILYFEGGRFGLDTEVDSESASVKAEFLSNLEGFYGHSFLLTPGSNAENIRVEIRRLQAEGPVPIDTLQVNYGEILDTRLGQLIFYKKRDIKEYTMVNVADPKVLAFTFANKLEIASIVQSNVLSISIKDNIASRAVLSIEALIAEYDSYVLQNKNLSANRTLQFIDNRLKFIADELYEVEKELEEFKRENNVPLELSQSALQFLGNASQKDEAITEVELQINVVQGLQEEMQQSTDEFEFILINPNISQQPPQLITDYNDLLQERNAILASATAQNPRVKTIESQLAQARERVKQWLVFKEKDLESQRQFLMDKARPINQEINALPTYERQMIEIMRQKGIKEALFTYLLQRKEETSMTLASEVSNVQAINEPYLNGLIWPSKKRIYMIFLIIGLSIPAIIVFLREYFDNKVYSTADIQRQTASPILGEIPFAGKSKNPLLVLKGSKTVIAEVFRLLRTNLQFFAAEKKNQVILITSSTSGEGKTFVSMNLAASMALSGKSVVVVGMDLRKPRLTDYLQGNFSKIGVTNYLVGQDTDLNNLLQPIPEVDGLYLLDAGPIPPNPNELLMGSKTTQLFKELRERFDYIIVDSSPVGLVADSLTLKSFVDTTIYLSKFNYTRRSQLAIVEDIYQAKKLPNVSILLNGIKKQIGHTYGGYSAYSYTYGYGYGYYEAGSTSRWKKFLKRFRGK